jgi:hypothetical protein
MTRPISYRLFVFALVVSMTSLGCADLRYRAALDSRLKELARTEDRTLSHTIRRLLRQLWNAERKN